MNDTLVEERPDISYTPDTRSQLKELNRINRLVQDNLPPVQMEAGTLNAKAYEQGLNQIADQNPDLPSQELRAKVGDKVDKYTTLATGLPQDPRILAKEVEGINGILTTGERRAVISEEPRDFAQFAVSERAYSNAEQALTAKGLEAFRGVGAMNNAVVDNNLATQGFRDNMDKVTVPLVAEAMAKELGKGVPFDRSVYTGGSEHLRNVARNLQESGKGPLSPIRSALAGALEGEANRRLDGAQQQYSKQKLNAVTERDIKAVSHIGEEARRLGVIDNPTELTNTFSPRIESLLKQTFEEAYESGEFSKFKLLKTAEELRILSPDSKRFVSYFVGLKLEDTIKTNVAWGDKALAQELVANFESLGFLTPNDREKLVMKYMLY